MTNHDFAFVADALLALCERDRDAPFFSEEELRLRKLYENQQEVFGTQLPLINGPDWLLRDECLEIYRGAQLTKRQATVLQKRLAGFTFEEIGLRSGHSKQGAQSVFIQAIKKLARSCAVYRYVGLSEVYRRETRRGLRHSGFGRMFPRTTRKAG